MPILKPTTSANSAAVTQSVERHCISNIKQPLCLRHERWCPRGFCRPLFRSMGEPSRERRAGFLKQGSVTEGDYCDWCGKPRERWTNQLRYPGMGKHYCSAKCYAAGEYRTNLYFALCSISVLAAEVAFLSFHLLSDSSEFYIGVTVFVVAILLVYSSVCAYFPVIGRAERRKRELNSRNNRYWDWAEE